MSPPGDWSYTLPGLQQQATFTISSKLQDQMELRITKVQRSSATSTELDEYEHVVTIIPQ